MSGLNQRFTKPSARKKAREFESHRLRKALFAKQKALRRREKEVFLFRVRFENLFRMSVLTNGKGILVM